MTAPKLHNHLTKLFPKEQVLTDELYRLVKGTDAGLYQLIHEMDDNRNKL